MGTGSNLAMGQCYLSSESMGCASQAHTNGLCKRSSYGVHYFQNSVRTSKFDRFEVYRNTGNVHDATHGAANNYGSQIKTHVSHQQPGSFPGTNLSDQKGPSDHYPLRKTHPEKINKKKKNKKKEIVKPTYSG